jgi:ATP-dependent DNA helicase RecG
MRTINGIELERRLSKSMGRTWDAIPVPKVTVDDLRQDAIDYFKEKAVAKERLTREDVDVSNQVLLENLNLFDDENHLVRAAVMAFHKDPEKWVTGAHIKIGFFVTDSDIRYMDEVYGSLIEQVDKTVDLVYTKYMKALIDYEGIHRIERYMFPPDAFKEILLNAVAHKDYRGCNPIQISVYEDKLYVYNDGTMPPGLDTTEKLFLKHSSKPFNPKLAQIFFKSGMIERWGRGFDKIREAC